MQKITRRSFIEGAAGATMVSGLVGLTPAIAQAGESNVGANPILLNKREGDVFYHSCLRNCNCRCLLKFRVQNGRMTYVSGAEEQEKTGTAPCVKGHTYVQYTNAPDRILHPMVAVGGKGSGKWRRISWDEAWELLTRKIKESIDKHGAESIMPYSYSGNYGMIGMHGAANRFFYKLGATFCDRLVCIAAGSVGMKMTLGTSYGPDPEKVALTDCYVSWGINETATNVHGIKYIHRAMEKGAKLLCVNPNRTPIASQSDVYLQPKPATDVWLVAGIMKTMVKNNWVDLKFVRENAFGYEKLLEQLSGIKMEDVVRITGVPLEKIEKFTQIYTQSKTAFVHQGYGINRNYNGARMVRAIAMLNTLAGQFGRDGSGLVYDNGRALDGFDWDSGLGVELITNPDAQHTNMTELDQCLRAENPMSYGKSIKPIHVLINYNGNPVAVAPNTDQVRKNFLREDLFTVGFDFQMTDTLEVCDLVLPAATQFESFDIAGDYHAHYVQICEKVIEPLGESMSNFNFFNELGRRMGFTDAQFFDTEEEGAQRFMKNPLDSWVKAWGKKGMSFERLKKEKFVWLDLPDPIPAPQNKYSTPSGKIELYS